MDIKFNPKGDSGFCFEIMQVGVKEQTKKTIVTH